MDPFEFDIPATCAHLGPGFGILGLAVDLHLRVSVEESTEEGYVVTREGATSHAPEDPRHEPILRALHAAKEHFEIKLPAGLLIRAHNAIPAFTGLGTNSASFAAGLGIAARYADRPLPADELLDLAVELGGTPAHSGAALYGGLVAVCPVQAADKKLRHLVLRYALATSWHLVIARPEFHTGAADAVRLLPANLPHGVIKRTTGRLLGLLHALSVGDGGLLRDCMVDEVHVPYRRKLVPGVDQALRAVDAAGVSGATISGAGPALVLMTTTEEDAQKGEDVMRAAFDNAGMSVEFVHLRGCHEGALPADQATGSQ